MGIRKSPRERIMVEWVEFTGNAILARKVGKGSYKKACDVRHFHAFFPLPIAHGPLP